jgi:hypothetical protein
MSLGQAVSKPIRFPFLVVFIGVLAWTTQWSFKAWNDEWQEPAINSSLKAAFFQGIPEPIRVFIADLCWITADEYIHFGGSQALGQNFLAGSFAGNTEILPLLQLAVRLDPTFFDVYEILSHNLAMYLGRFREAIRTIQEGILHNRQSSRLHELYGTIAFSYYFVDRYTSDVGKNPVAAMRYLDAALQAFTRTGPPPAINPPLAPRFYNMVRSRLFVEQGRPDLGLAAWRATGDSLAESDDLLALYLRRFAQGEPVPALPEEMPEARQAKSALQPENFLKSSGCTHEDCTHHSHAHSQANASHAENGTETPAHPPGEVASQPQSTTPPHDTPQTSSVPEKKLRNPVMERLLKHSLFYALGSVFLLFCRWRSRSFSAKLVRPST